MERMPVSVGPKIKSLKELKIGKEYIIDNDLHVLIKITDRAFIFGAMFGTYIVSHDALKKNMETYGIFPVKNS